MPTDDARDGDTPTAVTVAKWWYTSTRLNAAVLRNPCGAWLVHSWNTFNCNGIQRRKSVSDFKARSVRASAIASGLDMSETNARCLIPLIEHALLVGDRKNENQSARVAIPTMQSRLSRCDLLTIASNNLVQKNKFHVRMRHNCSNRAGKRGQFKPIIAIQWQLKVIYFRLWQFGSYVWRRLSKDSDSARLVTVVSRADTESGYILPRNISRICPKHTVRWVPAKLHRASFRNILRAFDVHVVPDIRPFTALRRAYLANILRSIFADPRIQQRIQHDSSSAEMLARIVANAQLYFQKKY
jgi:hypothetical protein